MADCVLGCVEIKACYLVTFKTMEVWNVLKQLVLKKTEKIIYDST